MLPLLEGTGSHCLWPDNFTERRSFVRVNQNEAYLEWLIREAEVEPADEGEEDDETIDEDEDDSLVWDGEEEDDVDEGFGAAEDEMPEKAEAQGSQGGHSVVRLVTEGQEGLRLYMHQARTFENFCGDVPWTGLKEHLLGGGKRVVGCIYDISNGSHLGYSGMLTAADIYERLRMAVGRPEPLTLGISYAYSHLEVRSTCRR